MSNMLGNIFPSESFQASHEEAFLETWAFRRKWAKKIKNDLSHLMKCQTFPRNIIFYFYNNLFQEICWPGCGACEGGARCPVCVKVSRSQSLPPLPPSSSVSSQWAPPWSEFLIVIITRMWGLPCLLHGGGGGLCACVPVCLWGKVGAATCVLPSSFIGHLSWVLARTLNFHTLQIHTICWGVHLDMSCPLPTSFILRTTYKLYRSPLLYWPGL